MVPVPAGISCRSKVTPSLRPGDQTEFTPNLLLDSFVYLQKSHPRSEDLNYIFLKYFTACLLG